MKQRTLGVEMDLIYKERSFSAVKATAVAHICSILLVLKETARQ